MDSQLTHMWVSFFSAAGIPSDVGAIYALTFAENRIQNDMLLDLNKEYLRDMGITRMGDVIAILRHAKTVHETSAREKILGPTTSKVPTAAVTGRITTQKPSSPVSRIVEHYTRNVTQPETPKTTPTDVATRLKRKPIQYNDITEAKQPRKVSSSLVVESSTTVFSRLGSNGTDISGVQHKKIFDRLGNKSNKQDAESLPEPDDILEYAGILKGSAQIKNVCVTTGNNKRKIAICQTKPTTEPLAKYVGTMRADEPHVSAKEKLNFKQKSVQFSQEVQYKEIKPEKKNDFQIFNKPERRLSMPEQSDDSVKCRLGLQNKNNNVNTRVNKSVFNRLGR